MGTNAGAEAAGVPDLGLFVVWSDIAAERERTLRYCRSHFEVRCAYEIHWTADLIPENCARFYGERLGLRSGVFVRERLRQGRFLLVTAVDKSPRYAPQSAATGPKRVNVRFLEAEQELRSGAGSGSFVHATVSSTRAARDLKLLLGSDPKTHLENNAHAWDGTVEDIHRDLSGARGWSSASELFDTLNHTVRYVVLRNFEDLPQSLHVASHEDVDLLTDDYRGLIGIMNARPHAKCVPPWGGPFWVKVSGNDAWFDLRFIGDHYYDPRWARAILDNRVWNERGFFSPSAEDYFEGLAYHALVHKETLAPDYRPRLAKMAVALGRSGWDVSALEDPARVKKLLDGILESRGYAYMRPRDVNVFFNFEATGHRFPYLRRKVAGICRKAKRLGYRVRYPLSAWYWRARELLQQRMPRPRTVNLVGPAPRTPSP